MYRRLRRSMAQRQSARLIPMGVVLISLVFLGLVGARHLPAGRAQEVRVEPLAGAPVVPSPQAGAGRHGEGVRLQPGTLPTPDEATPQEPQAAPHGAELSDEELRRIKEGSDNVPTVSDGSCLREAP